MAPQSKKKKPVSKKSPVKKTINKKRTRRKSKKSSNTKKNIFTVFGILLLVSWVYFVYMLGQNQNDETRKVRTDKSIKPVKEVAKKQESKHVQKSSNKEQLLKEHAEITEKSKSVLSLSSKKSKLVIIIDDVHTRSQLSAIQALKMKITPSIFPPYKLSPNSHMLAQGLEHYMIHLPMESGDKQFNKQYKTLKVSFSNQRIENRIKELRLLFPKAKYINNHTGSVFTSDYASMHLAYKIMKENGFVFIDSKTINTSKVEAIAFSFGDAYVSRDIFIDNKHNVPYIHQQLKKAVEIAKAKGFAVVIGHPHASTMKALSTSGDILSDVELVYIDGIYK
jgi:polysaccharide deacetylase 2 family uncharacterized protein YibQ